MKLFDMMSMNSCSQHSKPIQDKTSIVADSKKNKWKKLGIRINRKEEIVKEREQLKPRKLKSKCRSMIKERVYLLLSTIIIRYKGVWAYFKTITQEA